jgi:Protein of unknown function (DUF3352)
MSKSSRTNKSAKQKQSEMLMYIGIGAAVIAAGAGGAYFYFTQKAQAIKGILGAAAAIPQEAQVVMAFNTKADPWNKLAQFGTPASQKLISEGITKSPLNSLLVQSKTEYSRDVQPWLEGYIITALVPNAAQPQAPAATLVIARQPAIAANLTLSCQNIVGLWLNRGRNLLLSNIRMSPITSPPLATQTTVW